MTSGDILSKAICNMLGSKVILVNLIWNELIFYAGLIQKPGSVGLLGFLCHNQSEYNIFCNYLQKL